MVRPLALSLEACGNGIAPAGLFHKAHLGQFGVANHDIAEDNIAFHDEFPLLVFFFPCKLLVLRILIESLLTILLYPFEGHLELLMVVDAAVDAAKDLHFIDGLTAHAQIFLEEILVDGGAGDAHAHRSDG